MSRRGMIRKRCSSCGRRVTERRCPGCGSDRYSWGYVVDVGAVGGKRKQRTKSGFKTKAEAVAALAEVQAAVARGQHVEPDKVTLTQFLESEWLPAIETTIRPSTLASYRLHVERYIVPRIGEARLQQIGGSDLNALYAELLASGRVRGAGGLSPTTVRRVHATLHRAFRDAVRWGRLSRSPADAADAPRAEPRSSKLRTWSAEELRQFLHQTADDRAPGRAGPQHGRGSPSSSEATARGAHRVGSRVERHRIRVHAGRRPADPSGSAHEALRSASETIRAATHPTA